MAFILSLPRIDTRYRSSLLTALGSGGGGGRRRVVPVQLKSRRLRDGGVGWQALNRVLVEQHEVLTDDYAEIGAADHRTYHVAEILKVPEGGTLRAGVVDGFMADATVTWLQDGAVGLHFAYQGRELVPAPPPPVNLILALPRPKILERLLPQLATIGVHNIFITNANRVERCYFDSNVVQDEAMLRGLLTEGLMQAGNDTRLPIVHVAKRLKILLEDDIPNVCPDSVRILAHPDPKSPRIRDFDPPLGGSALLAIGPEGGWIPYELDLFKEHNFHQFSIGPRILRTEAACVASLALVYDSLEVSLADQ